MGLDELGERRIGKIARRKYSVFLVDVGLGELGERRIGKVSRRKYSVFASEHFKYCENKNQERVRQIMAWYRGWRQPVFSKEKLSSDP